MIVNHVSNSMLGIWQRCEVAWEFRYIRGLIVPPQAAAHRGGAMHRAIEHNSKQKITNGTDEPVGVLTDVCRDEFVKRCKEGVSIPKEQRSEKDKLLNAELNLSIEHTKIYAKVIAPKLRPSIVETKIKHDFGFAVPLVGILDMADDENCIHDFKSVSRKKPAGGEKAELQPSFYTALYHVHYNTWPRFRFHFIKDSDDERDGTRSQAQCDQLFARIRVFLASIQTGVTKPAEPGHWMCSEKWCGYWPICQYAQ